MSLKNYFILLFITSLNFSGFAQTVRYVKQIGSGLKDGSSWANASEDLQLMINSSVADDEVWVAKGRYLPNRKSNATEITVNDRANVFRLRSDVKVYGGFPDTGNPAMGNRNWRLNETTLSGDIGVAGHALDNTYNVVHSMDDTGKARLDGFTISDGYVEDWYLALTGAGIYVSESSPILANLKITNNYTSSNGSGLYVRTWENSGDNPEISKASPLIINCTITNNTAGTHGGGVNVFDAKPTFVNCVIANNTAYRSSGGMFAVGSAHVKLINVTITKNHANEDPGGVYILNSTKLELFNTIVFGNTSPRPGLANFQNPHNLVTNFTNSIVSGSVNPFVDMNGGNFTPDESKAAFGKGDNAFYNFLLYGDVDINGNPRLVNSKIDIGAIENQKEIIEITPTNGVLYVKKGATGRGDGSSWANAIPELAEALRWAKQEEAKWSNTNVLQIWVAQGTYNPNYPAENAPYSASRGRENTFLLVNNTQLYGGFEGTETSLSQRNTAVNTTILSGEIGDVNVKNDNIYNVVVAFRLSSISRLDGFTIKDGNSFDLPNRVPVYPGINGIPILIHTGAGIFSYESDFTIANCKVIDNMASSSTGGLFVNKGSVTIANSLFTGNNKYGVYMDTYATMNMINTTVAGNTESGVGVRYQCTFNMSNSIVSGNTGANYYSGFGNAGTIKNSLIGTSDAWNPIWGIDGGGNLLTSTNPFNNANNGDFRLSTSSLAKDKGNNSLFNTTTYGTKDLAGNNRIIGTIDMGAYELLGTNLATPVGNVTQYFCSSSGKRIADLSVSAATGANLYWYSSATGTERISNQAVLVNNETYYVSQIKDNNESGRLAINAKEYTQVLIGEVKTVPVKCFGNATGEIQITVTSGTAPYSYLWSNIASGQQLNFTTNKASGLIIGSYAVKVTDANGCTAVETVEITEPAKLTSSLSKTNLTAYGVNSGTASVNVVGGSHPYKYSWSNGATSSSIFGLTEGTYAVTVTDANNCLITSSIYVDGPPATPLTVSAAFGDRKNELSWAKNADTDIDKYNIYAGTAANPTVLLATVNHPNHTFVHTGLTNGITYYYKISAVDTAGNESLQATQLVSTPKAPQTITLSSIETKTYGDADFSAGATSSSTLAVSYNSSNNDVAIIVDGKIRIVGVGEAVITASQLGNNAFTPATSVLETLKVVPKVLIATLIGDVKKVYDGSVSAKLNQANYQLDGIVGADQVYLNYPVNGVYGTRNVGASIIITVNNLAILGAKAANYKLNSLTLNAAIGTITPATLKYVAQPASKIYGDNNPTFSGEVIGFVTGDTQNNATTGTLIYTSTANSLSQVSSYAITGSGLSALNYIFEQDNVNQNAFTINKRAIVIAADVKSKIYGNTDPILTYTITVGNLVNGDSFVGNLERNIGQNVGSYSINQATLNLNSNYSLQYVNAHLAITKALLTVTANNAVRCFGIGNPPFAVSYAGFRYNDAASDLSSLPKVSTNATNTSVAGNYVLSPSGAAATNYTFEYHNGNLLVNPLPINSVVSDKGTILSKGETTTLNVTSDNGVNYTWLSVSGIIAGQNTASLLVRPSETTTYTVSVANTNGCQSELSITIEVKDDYTAVKAENFLTPNGDGINDTWVINNIDMYPNHTLTIVDRAGRLVYTTRNYTNNWDGTFNGQPLAQGTYYYTLRFDTKQPGSRKASGFITIVRKNK